MATVKNISILTKELKYFFNALISQDFHQTKAGENK